MTDDRKPTEVCPLFSVFCPLTSGAGGCSSVGRAPALQAGGRRFDSDHLHQGGLRALWAGLGVLGLEGRSWVWPRVAAFVLFFAIVDRVNLDFADGVRGFALGGFGGVQVLMNESNFERRPFRNQRSGIRDQNTN